MFSMRPLLVVAVLSFPAWAQEPVEEAPAAAAAPAGGAADAPAAVEPAPVAPAPAGPALEEIAVEPLREAPPVEVKAEGQVLETIEVTAAYRKQNIQDVVGGAHVFDGAALDRAGATGLEDYLHEVPSVSLQKSGNGTAKISMRGISNVNESDLGYADGSPTTGLYLNDVAIQGSGVFPDLNIYDLARVEVLKGPQGTLYGEGSMGGAIKLITREPNFNEWELRGSLMGAQTTQGDDSYDGRIAVNVPLWDDRLGARIVGTKRVTGGFVDYTTLNKPDADKERADSLRGVLSWRMFDTLQLEFMHLADNTHREQFPVVDEGKQEELTNSREEDQYAITEFAINSLTARWELPFANLTSVSAVYDTFRDSRRRTPVLQQLIQTQFQANGLGTAPDLFANASTRVITDLDSFSQELRLVSFGGERINWIAGAFYRDRNQTFDEEKREDSVPDDPTGLLGLLLGGFNPVQGRQEKGFGDETFRQYAAYGEVTWEAIRSKLEITGGLRYFSEDISFFIDTKFYGIEAFLIGTDPNNLEPDGSVRIYFAERLKTDGILPKVSAAWHFNEDHMAYGSVSRGFRSGSPNIYAALSSGPPIIRPDYVWNKEIGTKSTWLDGRLITNLSAYHLDWKDMQGTVLGRARLGQVETDFAHLDNAGDAVVIGAEASIHWLVVDDLTLLLNAGYNQGEVTRSQPGSQVKQGGKLPNLPPWTYAATVNYAIELPWSLKGELAATYSYVDDQNVVFEPETQTDSMGNPIDITQRLAIPAYDQLKGQAGIRGYNWGLQFFGENLLDNRAIVAVSAPIPQYTVLTPRTLGIRLNYDF